MHRNLWPWNKVGQGQPGFIICANLVGHTFPTLHTKSQSQCPLVPEKKILKEFLTQMGMVAILVMWP